MNAITPSSLHRLGDAAKGPIRHFERERNRCLAYTNSLYGAAIRPLEEAMQRYAEALRQVIATTHRIADCRVSCNYITVTFPSITLPGRPYAPSGEITVFLPRSRDEWAPNHGKAGGHRACPRVTIRRPGDPDGHRRYQLRPNETPEQIWSRCARFFAVHAIDSNAIALSRPQAA
ncbi:MAG: hypothetical protein WCP45_09845 [Verrucomicrobiota bacterium]